jgi:hypothetical protein
MREISSNFNKGESQGRREYSLKEYEELIDALSKMHVSGSRDPETLCRSRPFKYFKKDSPGFGEIPEMQRKLFTLAYNNSLSWAREYYEY